MEFFPGQIVNRLEAREQLAAVVLTIETGPFGQILELGYTEGGSGWWPADCVEVPND